MINSFHLTSTDYDEGVSFAIVQGASFDWITFWHPDDISTWIPRGQIRTNYAQAGGIIKAALSFDPLVYQQQIIDGILRTGTKIRPRLNATQTQNLDFNLKKRRTSEEIAIPGKNVWVYDIELQNPIDSTNVVRLIQGFVEVSLEVTR